jgi:hypothetical protein
MAKKRKRSPKPNAGEYTATRPALTSGDVDADWRRADSVGEEAVACSVASNTRC